MPDRLEQYLALAGEQIHWKRAKPSLLSELRTHLLDERDACLRQGMSEEEAQAEAVRQMGDPVTVGQALDSVHRPKPQWGLLALTLAVALTSVLLRSALTGGWEVDVGRTLLSFLIGAAALFGGYFLDHTALGRHGKSLYLAALAVALFLGRADAGAIPGSLSSVSVLFPVVYAAWLYAWRGEGWKGFLLSCAGLFPLVAVGPHRYLSERLFLGLVGLLLLAILAWRDWYGLGKGRSVGLLAGGMGLLAGLLLAKGMTSAYLSGRLTYALHPELDPMGSGQMGMIIQQALQTARWTGQGTWAGPYPYERSLFEGQGDFFLTTVIHKLGWLPFLLLVLAVFLLAAWMLVKCLKQKTMLAQLTVLAVVVPLLLRGVWAVIMNLGVVMFTVHFPLLTGNTVLVIDMALIGLALSVFRQERLPMTNRVPGKPCAD